MSQRLEIRPNLFIIGAAKCGTTSLHDHLGGHPDIFMSDPKEPAFFAPKVGFYTERDRYLSLFDGAGDARWVGESSTHYTKLPSHPGVPERIAALCDEPRFIYLMRDPIERIISQYWHGVRQEVQVQSMFAAVRDEVEFTAFSDYGMQLEPYFDLFGRDRVLVLVFEELVAHPADVVAGVFDWLGVDPGLAPGGLERKNARPGTIFVPTAAWLHRFRHSDLWERIAPIFPRNLRRMARGLSRRPRDPDAVRVDEVVEFLRPTLREKVAELSRLLGREFPDWTTTLGDGPHRKRSTPAPMRWAVR